MAARKGDALFDLAVGVGAGIVILAVIAWWAFLVWAIYHVVTALS